MSTTREGSRHESSRKGRLLCRKWLRAFASPRHRFCHSVDVTTEMWASSELSEASVQQAVSQRRGSENGKHRPTDWRVEQGASHQETWINSQHDVAPVKRRRRTLIQATRSPEHTQRLEERGLLICLDVVFIGMTLQPTRQHHRHLGVQRPTKQAKTKPSFDRPFSRQIDRHRSQKLTQSHIEHVEAWCNRSTHHARVGNVLSSNLVLNRPHCVLTVSCVDMHACTPWHDD